MTYAFHPRNDFVFQQGDLGSKFYIVLEGEVDIIVTMDDGAGNEVSCEVGKCGKGDAFGELALITNKPRAAAIYCACDSHFAVLDKADYTRILAKIHELKITQKVNFLQTLPLFSTWTRTALQKLTYFFHEKTYIRKQIIYQSGDAVSELLLIKEGEIEVLTDLPIRPKTAHKLHTERKYIQKTEVAILGKGESVGFEEVFSGKKHQFTYICRSIAAVVLIIAREDFIKRVNNEESIKSLQKIVEMKAFMRSQRLKKRINLQEYREKEAIKPVQSMDFAQFTARTHSPDHSIGRNASVPRLYPDLSSRDSPFLSKSSLKQNFSAKLLLKNTEKPIFRVNSQPYVVNIHTFKQKNRGNKRVFRTNSTGLEPIAQTERTLGPFLTINFVDIVKNEGNHTPKQQPQTERRPGSSHSRLKWQKLSV